MPPLRGGIDKVLPGVFEGAIGVVVEIDAAKGVLHHVFHYPVGGEDLGGGRDVFGFGLVAALEGGKDLVFALRDIELIEPSNQLRLTVVVVGDEAGVIEHVDEAILGQNVIGQEQSGVIGDATETGFEDGRELTQGSDEDGELLSGEVVIIDDGTEAGAVGIGHRGQQATTGVGDDQRDADIIALELQGRSHQAIVLQNADGHEAVEPGVGRFFIDIADATDTDTVTEALPARIESGVVDDLPFEEGTTLDRLRLVFGFDIAFGIEAEHGELIDDALLQDGAGGGGEAFDITGVHLYRLVLPEAALRLHRVNIVAPLRGC